MAHTIRPFRDYSEHEVLNLYTFSGSLPVNKGTFVKVGGSGWRNSDEPIDMIGTVGQGYNNTVSQRYGLVSKVGLANSGDTPIGMILHNMQETDENGELLKFNPRKAIEMGVAISGQAVPVLMRGTVLYSGDTLASEGVVAGAAIYCADNGTLSSVAGDNPGKAQVGKALGGVDDLGMCLIKIEL